MKLRRFNANKEMKKIKSKYNKEITIKVRTIILSVLILVGSIILFTYARFSATAKIDVMHAKVGNLYQNDYNIIAYVDGRRTGSIPLKREGYIVTKVTCDNNAVGSWDNTKWAITIENATVEETTCSVYFVTPSEVSESEMDEPELFDGWEGKAGLIPVKYDNGDTVVADPENKNDDWYSYEDHEWANAVLVSNYSDYYDQYGQIIKSMIGETIEEENILQYYVWIPRFRYKLFNTGLGTSTDEQMIEVRLEKKSHVKSEGTSDGEWLTHPAFTFGSTELSGFWVGKFEPSHSDSQYIDSSTLNKLGCSNETCGAADGIIIKPNVISMVNNNIANDFYVSRSIENSSTFNLKSDKLDTHMMMNMEWGAVAYLSSSDYGLYETSDTCHNSDNNKSVTINGSSVNRCEIWINNTHTGTNNTSDSGVVRYGGAITGCSAKNGINDNVQNSMSNCGGIQYEWNGSINDGRSSTTGNIYGIYDMSGGANEYVMGNQSMVTSTYTWNNYSAGFSSIPDSKYYDKYLASSITYQSNASSTTNDMEIVQRRDQQRGLLGDATREIMKTYGTDGGGWNGDLSDFVSGPYPWFVRGGYANSGASAGAFYFSRLPGGANVDRLFRVILSAE